MNDAFESGWHPRRDGTHFHILNAIFRVIAGVHNSTVGHHGLQMCKKRLKAKGYNFTDTMITHFIRQYPCCQVMNRLRMRGGCHDAEGLTCHYDLQGERIEHKIGEETLSP